jgi:hypothetical protein
MRAAPSQSARMQRDSLYKHAVEAAQAHRHEVVSRLGDAHGEAASAEWNQRRFWFFAIDCAIEHVTGERFWLECGKRNFARAGQRPELVDSINELKQLRGKLAGETLMAFREKEELVEQIAAIANRLLE